MSKEMFAKGLTTEGVVIKSMLANLAATTAELKLHSQIAFASCIMHAMKHGDTTLANVAQDAIDAIGDAVRTNAVREYFVKVGPFYYDEDTKKLRYSKQKAAALRPEFEADQAKFGTKIMSKHWTEFKPEAPFQGYSLIGKMKADLKKAKKDLAEEGKKEKIRDADEKTIAALEAFLAQFDQTEAKKAA